MASYTIIGGDQNQYGPVSDEQLRHWIAEGRVNAQTQVLLEGTTEWKTLAEFPEFAEFGRPPAPAAAWTAATLTDILARDYDVDIGRCIARGWNLVKQRFWPIIGITFLVVLIIGVVNQLVGLISRPAVNSMIFHRQISVAGILIVMSTSLITTPVYTLFIAGLFKYFLRLIRGEDAGIGDAFSGFGSASVQLILLSLVSGVLTMLGYLLCILPGIYLNVAWFFAVPLVIDRQMPFWDAMELSRRVVSKHWFIVFAFLLVVGLLSVSGIIACCIGILVTIPIGWAAMMYAYEDIFSRPTR